MEGFLPWLLMLRFVGVVPLVVEEMRLLLPMLKLISESGA